MRYIANRKDNYFGTVYDAGEEITVPSDEQNPSVRQAAERHLVRAARDGWITAIGDADAVSTSHSNYQYPNL